LRHWLRPRTHKIGLVDPAGPMSARPQERHKSGHSKTAAQCQSHHFALQ
jgi:hypothetical protein